MRELFVKEAEVKGIERFMYIIPPGDGKESIGILFSDEEAKGIERGDVVLGGQDKDGEDEGS